MNIGDRVITEWGLTGTIIDTCGVAGGLDNYLISMDASAYTTEGEEICYQSKYLVLSLTDPPTTGTTTCTRKFWAEDEDYNPVPFDVVFLLFEGSNPVGTYTIPRGSYAEVEIDIGKSYSVGGDFHEGWGTPSECTFTNCTTECVLVYPRDDAYVPPSSDITNCTRKFWAEDEDYNPMPFDVCFAIFVGSDCIGNHVIPHGGYKEVVIDGDTPYRAVAQLYDGWDAPSESTFTGCVTESVFVYTGGPDPDTELPDGTFVCFQGNVLAKTGGFDGSKHLIVDRSDGLADVWSSDFTVGLCTTTPEPGDDDVSGLFGDIKPIYIILAIIAMIILR